MKNSASQIRQEERVYSKQVYSKQRRWWTLSATARRHEEAEEEEEEAEEEKEQEKEKEKEEKEKFY